MSHRLRLIDLRNSAFPQTNGLCATDTGSVAAMANRVQQRLLYCRESGEESWYGTWAEVTFTGISRLRPYITLAREIARIEKVDVCNRPVSINNQFLEYTRFGNGRMPKLWPYDNWCLPNVYQRNNAVTWYDLPNPPQKIRLYTTDSSDSAASLRVLIQGSDQNGVPVRSLDVTNQVLGEYVNLADPFAETVNSFSTIVGLQKDVTMGEVQFFAVNADGSQTLIHTMEPSEEVAGYPRYYFHNLPATCCQPTTSTPQPLIVSAIVKLEPIPVVADSDYLVIQNLEAMIEEAHSLRYSEMDNDSAKKQSEYHHIKAVRMLNGELTHYLGMNNPFVVFAPFGSAHLGRIGVNMR